MRRGINIRKKKKIIYNKINKKSLNLLSLLITTLIFCILIYIFWAQDIFIKINLEKDTIVFSDLNKDVPFSLNKIILFSSATAESDTINQLLSLNISNYCDIGIYLNKLKDDSILISSLYIDNISITPPELGRPCLYVKNTNDFGKCSFNEINIITDKCNFNIINTTDIVNYDNYEIYCDGTTPFSLGFYNKDIKTNFLLEKNEILYNGTLLKEAKIPLTSLNCGISFTINIITNSNEHYICNVSLTIPFEDENSSIYNTGYITKEFKSNEINKFIRIK